MTYTLEEIKETLEKISPGPWRWIAEGFQGMGAIYVGYYSKRPMCSVSAGWIVRIEKDGYSEGIDARNGEFIAAAPQIISDLVNQLEECQYKLKWAYDRLKKQEEEFLK